MLRFHIGCIRGIGDPDSYILPEQSQSSIPPAKINISLSVPFDKLQEDVQNQILPMLGFQPSEELKHEATINAVGKFSQAADSASNLLSAAEQPETGQQQTAARAFTALERQILEGFRAGGSLLKAVLEKFCEMKADECRRACVQAMAHDVSAGVGGRAS